MAATHSVRVPQVTRASSTTAVAGETTVASAQDRLLWIQVSIAAALGASAAMLGTWAIVATQTLHMHF
jgi:hypothetical protein